jgi:hypothetical protein
MLTVKRTLIVCTLLLPSTLSYSQQRKVYGMVKSEDGQPVEFCLVKTVNSDRSTSCDAQGEFFLVYDADSTNALFFYCLGFESKEVRIDGDSLSVVLKHKVNKLTDIVVLATHEHGPVKSDIMGMSALTPHGICTGRIGSEVAVFLGADGRRHGMLENIYFYITKEGIPNSKFRVHVYEVDSNYLPGTDLLGDAVIAHGNDGDEWVSVNVSSSHIAVGYGVFIAMEWIAGYGNSPAIVTSKKYPAQPPFNGQALAFTEDYNKRSSILYMRESTRMPWADIFTPDPARRNILHPMIYATYVYYK